VKSFSVQTDASRYFMIMDGVPSLLEIWSRFRTELGADADANADANADADAACNEHPRNSWLGAAVLPDMTASDSFQSNTLFQGLD
jgi:hypothetical protein